MHSVVKEKLAQALKVLAGDAIELKHTYWVQCFSDATVGEENTLKLTDLFGGIAIPVLLKDVETLQKNACLKAGASDCQYFEGKGIERFFFQIPLETSSVKLHWNTIENFVSTALDQIIGQPSKNVIEFEMKLVQLTLCIPGGRYSVNPPSQLEGAIGKFVLQVPVVGGYEGGRFQKETPAASYLHDWSYQSNELFHCALFISGCQCEWEPIKCGNMVALEYDIVWRAPFALKELSLSVPSFLSATSLIRESLSSWNIGGVVNEEKIKVESTLITEAPDGNPSWSDSRTNQQETDTHQSVAETSTLSLFGCSLQEEQINLLGRIDEVSLEHILVIPLEGNYFESNLNYFNLRGNDRQIVRILQSIDFIDTHLAVVNQIECGNPKLGEISTKHLHSIQISHWISSEKSITQFLKYRLEEKHLVETSFPLFSNPLGDSLEIALFPVIVIQPRRQSIRRCCALQFDVMLDHLEFRLSSLGGSRISRMNSLSCLADTLDYCQKEPLEVWDVSEDKAAGRTCRLLDICRGLRAEKAALELINILGEECLKVQDDGHLEYFCPGVGNETVAIAIVDLLLNSVGWPVYSESVLRLISSTSLSRQKKSLDAMVVALVKKGCNEGAIDVVKRIRSIVGNIPDVIRDPTVSDSLIDAVVSQETFQAKTALLELLVIPIFSELSPHQQCRLLAGLQKSEDFKPKGSSHQKVFLMELATNLMENDLCAPGVAPELIGGVVAFFVKLNDKTSLEKLIDYVLWHAGHVETKHEILWLETLCNAAVSSKVVKKLMFDTVKMQATRIVSEAFALGRPTPAHVISSRTESIVRLLVVLLYLERFPQLADTTRFTLVSPIFLTIPVKHLDSIAVDLIRQSDSTMLQHESGQQLMMIIGNALLDRCSYGPPDRPPALFYVVQCLAALPEVSAVRQFVSSMLKIFDGQLWDPYYKNLLIKAIVSSPDVWKNLVEKQMTAGQAWNSIRSLITSWMASLFQLMSTPTSDLQRDQYLQSNISSSFVHYFREEKQVHLLDQSKRPPRDAVFSPLILVAKMSEKLLGHLLWNVYQADVHDRPSFKTVPATLKLYTEMCRAFLERDLTALLGSMQVAIQLAICLLWLGNRELISLFVDKMSAVSATVIVPIAQSDSIRQLVQTCPSTSDALRFFLEQRLSAVEVALVKENAVRWMMPDASLPDGYRRVQEFLHSTERHMLYANFKDSEQAKEFASLLKSLPPCNGYSLKANSSGFGFRAKCNITKMERLESDQSVKGRLVREKNLLQEMIKHLQNSTDDSGVSPAKKLLLNTPIDC